MSETAPHVTGAATPAPAPSPANIGMQAIKEAVERLREALPKLREANPAFADGLANFLQRADDPVRLNQADFQHRIAYAVKDVEKSVGPLALTDETHRRHLNNLSTSAPGLTNERALGLLTDANRSSDAALRGDIRRTAIEIGKQADQEALHIRSQLDTLENRVRLSGSGAATQPPASQTAESTSTPASPGLDATGRPAAPGMQTSSLQGQANSTIAQSTRQAAVAAPPPEMVAPAGAGAVIASSLLRGFHKLGEAIPPPPWEPMTTNFGDRLKLFEARQQGRSDQKVVDGVEQSGKNALSALQSFASNEGAVMMTRINQAARSDPNGIEGVMAEMRQGGRYAGLRQQFNVAINEEKGFAAAYDKALEAVGQYAQDRIGAKPIIARSADAVAVTARLEAVEQNIGERMAGIPSRSDGKAMMDDLRQQAAEIFKAVAEGLKNMFQRATSGASASPSP